VTTYPTTGLPGGAGNPAGVPSWADPADIAAKALAVMRLDPADVDAARVESAAVSAMQLVDDYMDRADDPLVLPTPQPVEDATVQVTIELFRRKDAPFGVLNTWSESDVGPVRIGTDPMKGVEMLLAPYAHRYGVC
jgi:hypothetical protein